MPSTYTSRLRLTLPATGELINTWGTTVNTGITELVDASIAGAATISTWGGAGIAYTLSNNNGVADEARCMFIVASGAPGENKNIICPAVSKLYVVVNSVTGGYTVTLKTAAGTGIPVENGKTAVLRCDGTNVVNAITQLPAFVVAGGTANQVQYLNASKELTGSANLTFNGTNLGIGTSSPGARADVVSTTDGDTIRISFPSAATGTTGGGLQFHAWTNTATLVEQGRIQTICTDGSASYGGVMRFMTAGGGSLTEKMRLDSSGNLGLGVTPSAWQAGAKAVEIGGNGYLAFTGNAIGGYLYSNAYFTGTNTYKANGFAAAYGLGVSGQHIWYTAPSGTAGNAITFTQAMTLDASGNVGIGTSSPSQRLAVINNTTYQARAATATGNYTSGGMVFGGFGADASDPNYYGAVGYDHSTGKTYLRNKYFTATGGIAFQISTSSGFSDAALIDSSGNLGLGVTPSAWGSAYKAIDANTRGLSFAGGTESGAISVNAYWNSGWKYAGTSTYKVSQYQQFDGVHSWHTAPSGTAGNAITFTQAMTLDASGNLGVGTTSPDAKLDVAGTALVGLFGSESANNAYIGFKYNSTILGYVGNGSGVSGGSAATEFSIGSTGARALTFGTNDLERARITSGGDFCIGTTSASGRLTVDRPSVAATAVATFANSTKGAVLTVGVAAGANEYLQGTVNGDFALRTEAGNLAIGVSDNTKYIVFGSASTERARITSGGDFVLAQAGSYTKDFVQASENFIIKPTAQNAYNPYIIYRPDGSTSNRYFRFGAYNNLGNDTEWMRIVDGNLLVGTTSPPAYGSKLRVEGGIESFSSQFNVSSGTSTQFELVNRSASAGFDFYVNSGGTLAARITSGGDLLVGATTASVSSDDGVKLISTGSVYITASSGNGIEYYNTSASAFRFYVTNGGTIFATNTTISAISDQRFKENVRDLDVGLDAVMALKPRKFDWKAGKGKDIKGDRGFIAQEFEQVFPDLVDEWKDPAPEGEEPYKAVRADLIPVLVKAIQEQQALITDLRARVAALEAA